MSGDALTDRARSLFLTEENTFGCAEVTLMTLQEHFSLPNPLDSSPAMALNGGIAYSGATCGAITGAALAVGRLAKERITDHREAKSIARRIVQRLMAEFAVEHGSVACRDLTGYDMMKNHAAFIDSGMWRDRCMRQIEFAVEHLAALATPEGWKAEMVRIEAADEGSPASAE